MRLVWVLVAVLVPTWAGADSLGDAAKREKDRRQKNKDEGVVARVVCDDELKETRGQLAAPMAKAAPDADAGTETDSAPPRREETSTYRSRRVTIDDEPMWRARIAAARSSVQSAERREKEAAASCRGSRCPLLRQKAESAKQQAQSSRNALQELERQARLANVPPGWMR